MLCGAALRGVVRACALRHSQMWVSQAGSQSCILREGPVEASRRLAGAARLGEVQVNRCHGHDWWGLIMHAEGSEIDYIFSRCMIVEQILVEQIFADGHAKLFSGHSKSAPVHISAASARRRGPALTVELSQRDRERTDPRQLRQLRWRGAGAGGLSWSSGIKVDPACRASFKVN